jgi:hypothetical protein
MEFASKIDECWWMSSVDAQSRVGDLVASVVDSVAVATRKLCQRAPLVLAVSTHLQAPVALLGDSEADLGVEAEAFEEDSAVIVVDSVDQGQVSDTKGAATDSVVKLLPMLPQALVVDEAADSAVAQMAIDVVVVAVVVDSIVMGDGQLAATKNR